MRSIGIEGSDARSPGSPRLRVAMAVAATLALGISCWLIACDSEGSSEACIYNSDCPSTQICAQGRCVAECRESRDCEDGARCVRGTCIDPGAPLDAGEGDASGGFDAEDDGGAPDADESEDDTSADSDPAEDVGRELPDLGDRPGGAGEIRGNVHFRLYDDRRLPVANPVVYWTYPERPPEPLPDGRSCACEFPANAQIGGVDGSFILRDVPAGWVYLVVQKGNFRRHRLIEVADGETLTAEGEAVELPVRDDPETGDEIPSIVIGTGRFDAIEDIFAKLRLGPITGAFGFDHEEWMTDPDAWGIDLMVYQQPRDMEDSGRELVAPDFRDLLRDETEMAQYHMIFAPCADYTDYGVLMTSAAVRRNLRAYVNDGGKLYVTDYSYDVVEQVWPQHINFAAPEGRSGNADGHVGDPAYTGTAAYGTLRYESQNRVHDPILEAWLNAVGASADGLVDTVGNWVNLRGVGSVERCCDDDGAIVEITPDVVMSGPNGVDHLFSEFGPSHDTWAEAEREDANFPHTVRFDEGCGDVMYSTYHTVESTERSANLAPQELVLLYLILEINECNPDPIKE